MSSCCFHVMEFDSILAAGKVGMRWLHPPHFLVLLFDVLHCVGNFFPIAGMPFPDFLADIEILCFNPACDKCSASYMDLFPAAGPDPDPRRAWHRVYRLFMVAIMECDWSADKNASELTWISASARRSRTSSARC